MTSVGLCLLPPIAFFFLLPSDGSILDGLAATSSGAHYGLEGFVPWMLVDVRPVAGQERPGVRS